LARLARCGRSGGRELSKSAFSRVLFDEAAQAAESAALVPLMLGCEECVLVGDQKQLAPQTSDAARRLGLGGSLFARLEAAGVPCHLLDTQYRMHPAIAAFPSAHFYGGRIRNGVEGEQRPAPSTFAWPNPAEPVAFIGVGARTARLEVPVGTSKANRHEAEAVARAVRDLLKQPGGLMPAQLAVLTPYAAQLIVLREALGHLLGARLAGMLTVATVDSFQGMEYEALVLSSVRSNGGSTGGGGGTGSMGFLSDGRRLNVLLTRAKRGLLLFGHTGTHTALPLATSYCSLLPLLTYTPLAPARWPRSHAPRRSDMGFDAFPSRLARLRGGRGGRRERDCTRRRGGADEAGCRVCAGEANRGGAGKGDAGGNGGSREGTRRGCVGKGSS
jgi:superfamily I DNA and/or RNA helicase